MVCMAVVHQTFMAELSELDVTIQSDFDGDKLVSCGRRT